MSKVDALELNSSQRAKCASVIVASMRTATGAGEHAMVQIADGLHTVIPRGVKLAKAAREDIVNRIVADMGWNRKKREVQYRSEMRRLIDTRDVIAEAAKSLRKQTGSCTWHTAVTLARLILKHNGDTKKAVNEAVRGSKAKAGKKRNPMASAAIHFKAMINMKGLPTALKDGLRKLAAANKLNLSASKK